MKTIKHILLVILLLSALYSNAQSKKELEPYIAFLEKEATMSAKDYVISLFEDKDIVILCERHHQDITQYDLILDILQDPYFIDNVGVLFTEVGVRILNPELNHFLQDADLPESEVEKKALNFQRQCMFSVWEKSSFSYFIKGIRNINKTLKDNKKIEMYPTDVIYVEGETTEENVMDMIMTRMQYRDKLMGDFIIDKFNELKKSNPKQKALVIMNYRHAYKHVLPQSSDNTGIYLEKAYPGKVANVLINTYHTSKNTPLQDGKWDAAFKAKGIEDAGFSFAGSPFGEDSFDHWTFPNDEIYKTMFDGFIFFRPISDFKLVNGLPGFMDDGFLEEAVLETELYNKAFARITKREAPPVDKEKLMKLNQTQVNTVPDLDKIGESIDKWLK